VTRTVGTAEHLLLAGFYPVSDDAAATVSTAWRQLMNGAFKAVEHVGTPVRPDFKSFVVVVATHFAMGHNVLYRKKIATAMPRLAQDPDSSTLLSVIIPRASD
jgi:hypothetical protein